MTSARSAPNSARKNIHFLFVVDDVATVVAVVAVVVVVVVAAAALVSRLSSPLTSRRSRRKRERVCACVRENERERERGESYGGNGRKKLCGAHVWHRVHGVAATPVGWVWTRLLPILLSAKIDPF